MRSDSPFVGLSPLERGAALGLFVLFAAVAGMLALDRGDTSLIPVVLCFLAYLGVLALPVVLYRPGWGLFHPLVFAVLWWALVREVLPRLGLYGTGLEQHRALPGWGRAELNALVVQSTLLEILSLLCMYAGFAMAVRVRLSDYVLETARPRGLLVKMTLVAAVSLVALLRLVQEAGGLGSLLLQRGIASDETILAELGGHWAFLVGVLQTACLVWLALRPPAWRSPAFLGFFALALFITFAATGSRGAVIVPILAALSIWCLHYRKIPYAALTAAGVVVVMSVGVLGQFREETRGAESFEEVKVESGLGGGIAKGLQVIASRAEDIAGIYGILGKVPEPVGLLLGESYASVLAIPIPRALWPGKPDAGGRMNAIRIFNEPLNAIPPGNVGEAYWNFHLPGVILVSLLWGMVLKWLALLYRDGAQRPEVLLLFVITLYYLQPNSVAVYKWLQAIVPAAVLLAFFAGVRVRRRGAAAAALPPAARTA